MHPQAMGINPLIIMRTCTHAPTGHGHQIPNNYVRMHTRTHTPPLLSTKCTTQFANIVRTYTHPPTHRPWTPCWRKRTN